MLNLLSTAAGRQRSVSPWLVAIVFALGAWVFTDLAWSLLIPHTSLLFLGAIALTAYYGGIVPGLFSALVNFGLEYVFQISHGGNSPAEEISQASLMLLLALTFGYAADRTYRAERNAGTLSSDLSLVREELTAQKADFS